MNAEETINYILQKLAKEGACCLIIESQVKYVAKVYPTIKQVIFKDASHLDLNQMEANGQVKTPEELISSI